MLTHALPRQTQHQGVKLRPTQSHVLIQRNPGEATDVQAPRSQPDANAITDEYFEPIAAPVFRNT